jgi:hypothetical protein
VQASSLTSHGARPSRPLAEKRTKHRDDLENLKLISTIFPNYILPLASMVSRASVPRDFRVHHDYFVPPEGDTLSSRIVGQDRSIEVQ